MKARIRDFFETKEGWIFAVADYSHPDGLRSMLRYVPDAAGEREANGKRYRKMDFDPAYEFLRRERPDYVRDLHVVPEDDVLRIYRPSEGLLAVAERDPRVKKIAGLLAEAGVPWEQMGITGSMLVGLHSPSSDIDFVVYGPSGGRPGISWPGPRQKEKSGIWTRPPGGRSTPSESRRSASRNSCGMRSEKEIGA